MELLIWIGGFFAAVGILTGLLVVRARRSHAHPTDATTAGDHANNEAMAAALTAAGARRSGSGF